MADVQAERAKIITRLQDRQDKIMKSIRSAEDAQQQAVEDMDAAGTSDLRENYARKMAQTQLSQAMIMRSALVRLKELGLSYVTDYIPSSFVSVGSTIELLNTSTNETCFVMIVPHDAGNAGIGAVPEDSPVGKSVLGKLAGDTVVVSTGSKFINYKIVSLY